MNLVHPNFRFLLKQTSASFKLNSKQFSCLCWQTSTKSPVTFNQIDQNPQFIQSSQRRPYELWVKDRKNGYKTQKEVSTKQHIIDGLKLLKHEIKLWKEEVKELLTGDPLLVCRPGETDVLWTFGKDEDLSQFIVTSDSDFNEGQSNCSLKKSPAGYGLFSGKLDSTIPLRGTIKRTGYCNISSKRVMVCLN